MISMDREPAVPLLQQSIKDGDLPRKPHQFVSAVVRQQRTTALKYLLLVMVFNN